MRAVVVVDADAPVAERAALDQLERVALEDRRALRAEAPQALLEPRAARARELPPAHLGDVEREAVDRDEVARRCPRIAPIRRRAVEGADLDVALARAEQRRGQVEQREHVLLGEVRDALDHVVEAAALRRAASAGSRRRAAGARRESARRPCHSSTRGDERLVFRRPTPPTRRAGLDRDRPEEALAFADSMERARLRPWVAVSKETGAVVAAVDLHYAGPGIEGVAADEYEVGWVVAAAARGAGIATEAGRAAIDTRSRSSVPTRSSPTRARATPPRCG